MKKYNVSSKENNINSAISCGNCWGHQEYNDKAVDKQETDKGKMHAFIMKFVRRYF